MRLTDDEDDDRPELNVTPLIDCLFFLLTFFVMTSTLQDAQKPAAKAIQHLPLDLPEATAARDATPDAGTLVVAVDAQGRFYLNDDHVGIEELHRRVRAAAERHWHVRIDGDRQAAFDAIARVIDLCEFEGLHDIAVRTRDR